MDYQHPSEGTYRTFLCYRRPSKEMPCFAASENIAGMLNWWLNHNPIFAQAAPALFEERCKKGTGLTYDENGIQAFMPHIKTCIVVICPDFFNRELDAYDALDEECETKDEQIQKTRTRLSSGNNKDFCYLELKYAAEFGCKIIPVFVTVKGEKAESGWKTRVTQLTKILGQASSALFATPNTHTVDYDKLASCMDGVRWNEIGDTDAAALMQSVEKSDEGKKLLHWLQGEMLVSPQPGETAPVDTDILLADLQRCARSFLNLQQPSSRDDRYFYAGNPKVIYDPVRSCNMKNDPQVKPPFLAACLVESFLEKQNAFGLQMDNFSYWNVNLDPAVIAPQELQSIPLSVCAVCFGTLSVHHYMTKEWERLHKTPLLPNRPNPLLNTIRSGQNLLLALRNPYTKIWPSTWDFNYADAQTLGTEGTTNQTNLSLATLMSCGFLDPDIPQKYLKPRYAYIWESVEVLLSWRVTRGYFPVITGWRYAPRSQGEPALLPTVFVFDTLSKLKQTISKLLPVFSEDAPFYAQLQRNLQTIDEILLEILAFIAEKQCTTEREHLGAFRRFERTEFSVTHTAYVIKSLYQYAQDHGDETGGLQSILDPAIDYLVKRVDEMKENGRVYFRDFEVFEDFCDSEDASLDNDGLRSTYGEKYEHCAELIVGEALIKIAEYTRDEALCSRVMEQLRWLFNSYTEDKRVIGLDGDTLRVKGIRDFLPYPIYGLYYYRMFLWDYLLLLEEKGT